MGNLYPVCTYSHMGFLQEDALMWVPCCVTMATTSLKGSKAMHEANISFKNAVVFYRPKVDNCLLLTKGS